VLHFKGSASENEPKTNPRPSVLTQKIEQPDLREPPSTNQVPAFAQTFPDLMFNPPGAPATGIRSFANQVLDTAGNPAGYITARGNSHQPGSGNLIHASGLEARCVAARAACLELCAEEVLMAPTGPLDRSGNFFKCMHRCMEAAGCE
jgi:hypothetical protein